MDISFVAVFALFFLHFLWWYYLFFLYNLCNFLLFSVDFTSFMLIFIIACLSWDRLVTKKEFILPLSCVSVTIIVSVLNVRQFIGGKTFTSASLISADSLLWWLLFPCWKNITFLELPCLEFLQYLCCSPPYPVLDCNCFFYCFCLGYSHFDMFGTVYYFFCLLGSLALSFFGLLVEIRFSLNLCSFVEYSCMDLSSPV